MTVDHGVIIVGAGIAGLSCARALAESGMPCAVLEAGDGVGGRVRTDRAGGFLFDRGFQVLLTAYPEARASLDLAALDLRPFLGGALVRIGRRFHRVADPWRVPSAALTTLLSPTGTLADKIGIARLRRRVTACPLEEILARPETTTLQALEAAGFSRRIVESFFRPFFGGVLLDRGLAASSRQFEFLFRMFSTGEAALPAAGMGAIPSQIAARLPAATIRTNARVESVGEGGAILSGGERAGARCVVVATEGPEAARLLRWTRPVGSRPVTCLYFAAETPPIAEPILVLNGEGKGPVNNLCVPSRVVPGYAPEGASLVSATVLDDGGLEDAALVQAVVAQLKGWFGDGAGRWRHLRTYRIAHALPDQAPPFLARPQRPVRVRPGLYVCGDHVENGSINGAIASGRRAAAAVLEDLRR